MNILLILTATFDQGGTQNDMVQLATVLGPRGYDIHLAAPPGTMQDQLEQVGVVFHPVPSPVGGIPAQLRYTRALATIVRENEFDILAPQSIRAALAAGLLRTLRISRAPIVTSLHNLHDPKKAGLAGQILHRCCDLVTFENHFERRLVGLKETNQGRPTRVVYSGVDLERFSTRCDTALIPGLPVSGNKLVGCVARLSPEKDHETLLRAWFHHSKIHPNDHLVLIGDGPCRPAIERTIASLGIGSKVTLLGERNDVDDILPHLDLFVLSSSRESYPRSAREAMACGVPVILPAIGGCAEITANSKAGALFRSGDPEDLARLISLYLGDADFGSEMQRAARRHAEQKFPLEKWRDTMDDLYRQFIVTNAHQNQPRIGAAS